MRIRQSLLQPNICQAATWVCWKGQWLGAEAEGLWSNPSVRAAVDCGETDQGDVREEIMVGNAYGGKPGKPWEQGNTAESCIRSGANTIASLSPHASICS